MRIGLILLTGLTIISLGACKRAEQEATTALRKACTGIVNKVQAPTITIQKTSPAATYTTEAADQGPRNIWEAAELARTW
ncbi:MAG: hypothetical protein RLZ16_788 [Bacteroidota bacterium]